MGTARRAGSTEACAVAAIARQRQDTHQTARVRTAYGMQKSRTIQATMVEHANAEYGGDSPDARGPRDGEGRLVGGRHSSRRNKPCAMSALLTDAGIQARSLHGAALLPEAWCHTALAEGGKLPAAAAPQHAGCNCRGFLHAQLSRRLRYVRESHHCLPATTRHRWLLGVQSSTRGRLPTAPRAHAVVRHKFGGRLLLAATPRSQRRRRRRAPVSGGQQPTAAAAAAARLRSTSVRHAQPRAVRNS